MLAYLRRLASGIWPFAYNVHIENLEKLVENSGAEPWHLYAIRQRYRRRHVCLACYWLTRVLSRKARIFEPGCGSGVNLLWLASRGFTDISGADLSKEAIALGGSISRELGLGLKLWKDDSLRPRLVPFQIEGLISLNWLYHIKGASLDLIFDIYRPFMAPGCKIVFDMVDESYNREKNNEFHTDDFHLPINERRDSEYKLRLSKNQVKRLVERHACKVLRHSGRLGKVPRRVWLVESLA